MSPAASRDRRLQALAKQMTEDLATARIVARAIYGDDFQTFVLAVYDRLLAQLLTPPGPLP